MSDMHYTIRRLEKEEISRIYKTYMTKDFPSAELKPLSHIIRSVDRGYGFALGVYEGASLIAYAVLIVAAEEGCALLDYLAVVEECRGKGVGHEAFRLLGEYFEEKLPAINGIYIEAEMIHKAKNEREREVRSRRIAFYQSCGCVLTELESKLFGVEYSILYRKLGEGKALPTMEAVDTIYRTMFKKAHYKHFVTLVMKKE